MLKMIPSKINPYIFNFKNGEKFIDSVNEFGFKKNDIYSIKNGEAFLQTSENEFVENIFQIYSEPIYDLFKAISFNIDDVCSFYEINKEKQKYMIYGKISNYGENNKNSWYDFPGQNKPFLHGFYFPEDNSGIISFKNISETHSININPGLCIINKPTDLVNIKFDFDTKVIEFYIFPLFALKHINPGVWCPL